MFLLLTPKRSVAAIFNAAFAVLFENFLYFPWRNRDLALGTSRNSPFLSLPLMYPLLQTTAYLPSGATIAKWPVPNFLSCVLIFFKIELFILLEETIFPAKFSILLFTFGLSLPPVPINHPSDVVIAWKK